MQILNNGSGVVPFEAANSPIAVEQEYSQQRPRTNGCVQEASPTFNRTFDSIYAELEPHQWLSPSAMTWDQWDMLINTDMFDY